MNRLIVLLFCTCLLATETTAQRIKGSDTVLPLTQKLAEAYIASHPGATITVTGGGSGVGLSALNDRTTDIAMSSRSISFGEKMKLKQKKTEVDEIIIAYDALAVIVHPSNLVDRLTREQLENIFRGKITNWEEVGGNKGKIVVYARETSSGTYEFFKESALENKNYMSSVLSMPATGAVIQSVKQTKGAIGYVGLAYLNPHVKPLQIAYDSTGYYAPTVENSMEKKYPIVRPLYYYCNAADREKVKGFIDFILSPAGQKIVRESGYIPVTNNQ